MTLDPCTIDAIKRQLARGIPQRQIVRLLDRPVSRGTIQNVQKHLKRFAPNHATAKNHVAAIAAVEKCPICNYRVVLPCKICAAREARHVRKMRYLKRKNRRR